MKRSDITLIFVVLSAIGMFRWWLKKERNKKTMMFSSLQLASKESFDNFFAKHSIPLQGELCLPKGANSILVDAQATCSSFERFIATTLLDKSQSILTTNFVTSEEAYEMYRMFTMGYIKNASKH